MSELIQPPDNNFTLRQVVGHPRPVQLLAVDDVYSIHEEFDEGFNPNRWGVARTFEGGQNFEWDDQLRQGGVIGVTSGEDNASIRLFSRLPTWSPHKRCSAQMRFTIDNIENFKMEFGFVNSQYDLEDPTKSDGAVLVKATPTATQNNFQVVVYDTDDDTNLGICSRTRNSAISLEDQPSSESILTDGEHVLQIFANESGGTAFWLNGRFYGSTFSQPLDVSAFDTGGASTEVGNPRLRFQDSSYKIESGSQLWVYMQNRTASVAHSMTIDYIKAWQERRARDF